ncbi:HAD family hydrolase [Phycisphaerales bacterium AB-hyl4]|uniref:phosphoglycolate phosphatase n=1 Tax=Natronomicrosphaera hydrolytica TaxID=3242702 RepID=A0ABV4U4D7_9BACT
MQPHHLILFDIDGTLLNARGAGGRSMQAVADRLFGNEFTFNGMSFSGKLDPAIFAEAAHRNQLDDHETHHDAFREAYLEQLKADLARDGHLTVNTLPGVHELIDHLHQRQRERGDVILGLLTGNYAEAAPLKLAAARINLDCFKINAFGDEGQTRPDLVALAMTRYTQTLGHPPDPQRIIVIGDTPHDIDCAKAHRCIAFAVATGRFNAQTLRDHGADIVVPDFADPSPLLQLLP